MYICVHVRVNLGFPEWSAVSASGNVGMNLLHGASKGNCAVTEPFQDCAILCS